MPAIPVNEIDDSRLDDYRNISDRELLRRSNLFVAEGRLVVRRLLSGRHRVVSLLLNEPSFRHLEDELQTAFPEVPAYVCRPAVLDGIVGFNVHRGCLALAERPRPADPSDVARAASLLLVLDGVNDPDNVGSAFRNAAAFGVDGVLLSRCCDPLYRKAIRTSMGHVLQMPYGTVVDVGEGISALKSEGFRVIALTPAPDATALADFVRRPTAAERLALVAGSEADGLSPSVQAAADHRVRIPMHRGVDSLNVATAVAIALERLRS
jgi:tRNA G18 (ribose-2'-O)-methylase SpoU